MADRLLPMWERAFERAGLEVGRKLTDEERAWASERKLSPPQIEVFKKLYARSYVLACSYLGAVLRGECFVEWPALCQELGLW